MENYKSTETASNPAELLNSFQHKIEETTQQFIKTFEQSATEVKTVINREFSQKPWMYFTSFVGAGVVIGYFVGRSQKK
jgi:uncharacterized membrane-anchored protein YhcB (DUF1043 family)